MIALKYYMIYWIYFIKKMLNYQNNNLITLCNMYFTKLNNQTIKKSKYNVHQT